MPLFFLFTSCYLWEHVRKSAKPSGLLCCSSTNMVANLGNYFNPIVLTDDEADNRHPPIDHREYEELWFGLCVAAEW